MTEAVRYVIKTLKILLLVAKIIAYTVMGLLLTYAVCFSIAASIVLFKGYQLVKKPLQEVTWFRDHNPSQTAFMKHCLAELAGETPPVDTLLQTFIPLDSISPNLTSAVLAAEDDAFYLHPGFDVAAILAATEYNRIQGSNKHGGSTITQQMAKNLFLSSDRTFHRKYLELLYAVLMERYLGKERILELYMNYAQWGKNIFGCEAASRYYFKKSSRNLSITEAARLAAVLAKPSSLTPHYSRSVFMSKRLAVIAQNLYLHHSIDDSGYFALTGTLPFSNKEKENGGGTAKNEHGDPDKVKNRVNF